jgi:uncharacterized LabA/DUF88 family protein
MLAGSTERIVLFIDAPGLYRALAILEFDIDFRKLLSFMRGQGSFLQARFYVPAGADERWKALGDWLSYTGYIVPQAGKGSGIATSLAADALRIADTVDHVLLISDDGSLSALVAELKQRGRRVTIISTLRGRLVADALRRAADAFIDLADLRDTIGRARVDPRPVT